MHDSCTEVSREASLLCNQQVISESGKGISKATKLHRLRADNGRDQVPISIEKIHSAPVYGRSAVQTCGNCDIVSDDGDGRAKEVVDVRGGAQEGPEELASRPIKEINCASILARN